jgi:hypothetical protein
VNGIEKLKVEGTKPSNKRFVSLNYTRSDDKVYKLATVAAVDRNPSMV